MEHPGLFKAQCEVYDACWASYMSPETFEDQVKKAEEALRKVVIEDFPLVQDIPLVRDTLMVRYERISKILSTLYAIQIAYPTEDMSLPEATIIV